METTYIVDLLSNKVIKLINSINRVNSNTKTPIKGIAKIENFLRALFEITISSFINGDYDALYHGLTRLSNILWCTLSRISNNHLQIIIKLKMHALFKVLAERD